MEEKKFVISKKNYLFMAISIAIIILGFILMTGKPSGVEFDPDIYSTRRIVVAPIVSLIGFICMIIAIMYKPKNQNQA